MDHTENRYGLSLRHLFPLQKTINDIVNGIQLFRASTPEIVSTLHHFTGMIFPATEILSDLCLIQESAFPEFGFNVFADICACHWLAPVN
jgi:hypothetical protein